MLLSGGEESLIWEVALGSSSLSLLLQVRALIAWGPGFARKLRLKAAVKGMDSPPHFPTSTWSGVCKKLSLSALSSRPLDPRGRRVLNETHALH